MSRKVADLEAKLLLGPRDRRAEKELGVGKARYYILYNFCIIYIVYILYSIYMEVSIVMGSPKRAGFCLYIMEDPKEK